MSDARRDRLRADDLVGTWRLSSWESLHADGQSGRPFGMRPRGYVIYTADGHMITAISKAGRAPVGGDLLSAPEAARAKAFGSFVAYSGTFRVDGGAVIHRVEISLYPDWVGSEQHRDVRLSEDRRQLTLSSEVVSAGGVELRHRLRWTRVPDGTA